MGLSKKCFSELLSIILSPAKVNREYIYNYLLENCSSDKANPIKVKSHINTAINKMIEKEIIEEKFNYLELTPILKELQKEGLASNIFNTFLKSGSVSQEHLYDIVNSYFHSKQQDIMQFSTSSSIHKLLTQIYVDNLKKLISIFEEMDR
jgi:hypothetical protein